MHCLNMRGLVCLSGITFSSIIASSLVVFTFFSWRASAKASDPTGAPSSRYTTSTMILDLLSLGFFPTGLVLIVRREISKVHFRAQDVSGRL